MQILCNEAVFAVLGPLMSDDLDPKGFLIGLAIGTFRADDNEWIICNVCFPFSSPTADGVDLIEDIALSLPGGLGILGLIFIAQDVNDVVENEQHLPAFSENLAAQANNTSEILSLVVSRTEVVNAVEAKTELLDGCVVQLYNGEEKILSSPKTLPPIRILGDEVLMSSLLLVRSRGSVSCHVEVKSDEDEFFSECQKELQIIVDTLLADGRPAFKVSSANNVIITNDMIIASSDGKRPTTIGELYQNICQKRHEESGSSSKRKAANVNLRNDGFDVQLLQRITGKSLVDKVHSSAPLVHQIQREFEVIEFQLHMHAVAVCRLDQSLADLYATLCGAMERQLKSNFKCLVNHSMPQERQFVPPVPLFFFPRKLSHPLCLHYPANKDDSQMESYRKQLHGIWNLPLDWPCFRWKNALKFTPAPSPYLRNVHLHVPQPNVDGATIACVIGEYEYRHYMQDSFNDKGWGCAYRSFQTIWSWFLLQGYCTLPVPTHPQIQQALVDVGDQEKSFVGSRKWIGSLELSYCLNQMLDITSKILSVSSGSELASVARALLHHFQTQGTPVMIGGGVLAHTILGVCFNAGSGDAKFLVLDPHYTGEESLSTVVSKGWCGWKPITFWENSAFFNLLLPQRPAVF